VTPAGKRLSALGSLCVCASATLLVSAQTGSPASPTPPVHIDSISPAPDYRSKHNANYDFDISGENLAPTASGNTLIAVGSGPVAVAPATECAAGKIEKPCLSYDPGMEGRKLHVSNYHSSRYEGPAGFEIQVGTSISNAKSITFSAMRAGTIRLLAIASFLVIALIVLALVWGGVRKAMLAGESCSPVAAFFLDRQTNSYSLSKFQLLAWTAVSIFGYLYVFFCRLFIQWKFDFPPVPAGLPTLLGISAGTTIAAVGITVNRGSKGAGPIHPTFADFISSGGLVASDRFQFFVWTLVGCLVSLTIILACDPGALSSIPDVPPAFLALMGISSAGYLAGKFTRAPGPIISLLTIIGVVPAAGGKPDVIKMRLKGQNLSSNAMINVGTDILRIDQFDIIPIEKQAAASNPSFCTEVEVDLMDATKYLEGPHILILLNEDGQGAAAAFPLNALAITRVPTIAASTAPTPVRISGNNFSLDTSAEWWDATGGHMVIPKGNVKLMDETQLELSLIPGAKGQGKLVLASSIGLKASSAVMVQ
jgi:hypothetical protein